MLLVEELSLPHGKKVSVSFEAGVSYGLTGPNGSGKSLLLKSLAHLLPTTFKSFTYQGKSVLEYSPEQYRSSVLYLPSVPSVTDQLSVEDYISLPLKMAVYKNHRSSFAADSYIKRFGLEGKTLSHLSSGQKQVLSFLRAMTLKADVLLLDEPTSHLDPAMTQELESLLLEWKNSDSRRSFVLVSHHDEQVRRLTQIQYALSSITL